MGNRASNEAEQNPPLPPPDASEEQQMSYWQMIKQGYQELVNAIVRPPRCQYEEVHLGPKEFVFCRKKFRRVDFDLTNKRDMTIKCSIWEPHERPNEVMPCVIYMHGNSSARVEALPQLALVLSLGATLVSFDFAGSGKSGGEYVSLGYFEKDDLDCVIEHLRNTGRTSTIALWGRSMGAATALLHGERDPSIAGMVLDSAFASLTMLAEEMVEKGKEHGVNVPGFVVRLAIRWIRSSVQKLAGFDIHDLTPIEHADKCYIPALFVAASGDDFVPSHHSQQIHDRYAGDKNIIIVDGDHNTMRPQFLFDSAGIFLASTLQIPEHWMLEGAELCRNGRMPWALNPISHSSGGRDMSYDHVMAMIEDTEYGDDLDFEEGFGMTAARQAEVRGALFNMLGSTAEGQITSRQRTTNDEVAQQTIFSNTAVPTEPWSCTVCTLINPPDRILCKACGCAHMSE